MGKIITLILTVFFTAMLLPFMASADTATLTVSSCSNVSGDVTISNCTGLNSSNNAQDVTIPQNGTVGIAFSNPSFSGNITNVIVTLRNSGESEIDGTLGVIVWEGDPGNSAFCEEDISVSNQSGFLFHTINACTPSGGWIISKLSRIETRIKNNDGGDPSSLYLSFAKVTVSYSTNVCGNNTTESPEECDGSELVGQTCASKGFTEGTLSCSSDCLGFDTSQCTTITCGNSTIDSGETCDGTELDGQTCESLGFESGTLSCNLNCSGFETSLCIAKENPLDEACGIGCCGSGTCDEDFGEDYGTCSADCITPKNIYFDIKSPTQEQQFAVGDTVTIKAGLKADSIIALNVPDFNATGKFGTIILRDDGQGEDQSPGDGFYSGQFAVEEEFTTIMRPIELSAKVEDTIGTAHAGYQVIPNLAINFGANKKTYLFGDLIKVNGKVARKGAPLKLDLNAVITGPNQTQLHYTEFTAGNDGSFSFSFQTSTIHPEGEWKILVSGNDELGNYGYFEKAVNVLEPRQLEPISFTIENDLTSIKKRGESIKFTARVKDEYDEHVDGATVNLIGQNGKALRLLETSNQSYTGFYIVPFEMASGSQKFELRASKETPYTFFSGAKTVYLQIAESTLNIMLLEPTTSQFRIGDEFTIKVKVSYENSQPVDDAAFDAKFNGKQIYFTALEPGVFSASYFASEEDTGRNALRIRVTDRYQNFNELNSDIFVSTEISPNFYLKKYPLQVLLAAVVFFTAAYFLAKKTLEKISEKNAKEAISGLEAQIKKLNEQYFKLESIDRDDYEEMSSHLNTELESQRKKLEKLAKKEKK